jgi:hypothetical protein
MKSCLLNTVSMLLPYSCLQCCSPVGPNGKHSAEYVQCSVHKANDLKSYDTQQLTTVSHCEGMHCEGGTIKGVSGACAVYGGDRICIRGFGAETWRPLRRTKNK